MDQNQNQINSQQLSYEQFQAQVRKQREMEQQMAQQALRNAGLDPKSQQVQQVIQDLQGIQSELNLAENQLQMQMDAQKRQIQNIQQKLQQAMNQCSVLTFNVECIGFIDVIEFS